jgi:hypothetical protein
MHKQRLIKKNEKQTKIWQEYTLECSRAMEHER